MTKVLCEWLHRLRLLLQYKISPLNLTIGTWNRMRQKNALIETRRTNGARACKWRGTVKQTRQSRAVSLTCPIKDQTPAFRLLTMFAWEDRSRGGTLQQTREWRAIYLTCHIKDQSHLSYKGSITSLSLAENVCLRELVLWWGAHSLLDWPNNDGQVFRLQWWKWW